MVVARDDEASPRALWSLAMTNDFPSSRGALQRDVGIQKDCRVAASQLLAMTKK
jgi:hypothetical protein